MDCVQSNDEDTSFSNLNGLIKLKRNADFKSVISSMDKSDLINNMGGKTLMHTAAIASNNEIIVFLFNSGFDFNARNALGQTPLHLALSNEKFKAAQLLLSLGADILVSDNEGFSTFHLCFRDESQVPQYVAAHFLARLNMSGLSVPQMMDVLKRAGCSIFQVLFMNNAEVAGQMLDRISDIDEDDSCDLLQRALTDGYLENIDVVLKRGPRADERLKRFIDRATSQKSKPAVKFYTELVIHFDLVTEYFATKVGDAFGKETEDILQVYLDLGMDDYVRETFGRELLAPLFANDNVDCIKMIENRKFDVNRLGVNGLSALLEAARHQNKSGMIYLLENGADPNVNDFRGLTPLIYCWDDELVGLLLDAGADMHTADNGRLPIGLPNMHTGTRAVAEICILEARDLLTQDLTEAIRYWTGLNFLPTRIRFDDHRQDLEWMKTRKISESVSLFSVLIGEVGNMSRRIKSEDDVEAIMKASRERELQPSYASMLQKNLNKILKMNALRHKAAEFLSPVMEIDQTDHLVIEKIVNFFSYRDLLVFDRLSVKE